jgi:hypothetical protein
VGKASEASVAESTNFTLSGSQTGRPEIVKSRRVEVVNWKLLRFGPETAEKSLVLLRYTHAELAEAGQRGQRTAGMWRDSLNMNNVKKWAGAP